MVNKTDFTISIPSQKELLSLARKAIGEYLENREVIDFSIDGNDELIRLAAVFVTLTQNGNLRGCIGTIEPEYPLCEAVIRMALSAALHDSRFFPMTIEELPKTKIDILEGEGTIYWTIDPMILGAGQYFIHISIILASDYNDPRNFFS